MLFDTHRSYFSTPLKGVFGDKSSSRIVSTSPKLLRSEIDIEELKNISELHSTAKFGIAYTDGEIPGDIFFTLKSNIGL